MILGDTCLPRVTDGLTISSSPKDGKNIIQLRWASIEAYVMMHYNEVILEGLISMSYPTESVDRTLSLHLQYLLFGNVALAKESMEHCEELMFVLRPYVFAAHRVSQHSAHSY